VTLDGERWLAGGHETATATHHQRRADLSVGAEPPTATRGSCSPRRVVHRPGGRLLDRHGGLTATGPGYRRSRWWADVHPDHTYVDGVVPAQGHTVTVTVTDDDAGQGSDDLVVTVINVNPSVDALPDGSVVSGEIYELTGGFSDPGVEDDRDWSGLGIGDNDTGSTSNQAAAIVASQRACAAGDYSSPSP